jgi:mannose-6-phosphate isomerase-like protein (cupin superfamily)
VKEIREIKHNQKTIAIIYSKTISPKQGVKFLTPQTYPLQIGLHEYQKGAREVPTHYHPHLRYKVTTTQEFLFVEKGKMDVEIYTNKWQLKAKATLTAGDFVLFVDCGHGIKFHKGAKVFEIKQGPYPGDKKAKIFRGK